MPWPRKWPNGFSPRVFKRSSGGESERLKREVFRDVFQEGQSGSNSDEEAKNESGLPEDERIYVFISESVPLQTLRNFAADLDKMKEPNVIMVLRGFVGGMTEILPTARFVSSILQKDPDCDVFAGEDCLSYQVNIQIDPLLFRRYHIERVPAVVFAKGVGQVDNGFGSKGLEDQAAGGEWFSFMGDASLGYSLERINKEAQSKGLKGFIKKLKKGV